MKIQELRNSLSTAAVPEFVEAIKDNQIAFVPHATASVNEIEDDLVRSVGRLRRMSAADPKAPEAYSRITGLWKLRTDRLGGKDDGWVSGLIEAVGSPEADPGDGPTEKFFDGIRSDMSEQNDVEKERFDRTRSIDEIFGRSTPAGQVHPLDERFKR